MCPAAMSGLSPVVGRAGTNLTLPGGSEPESFSDVSERRAKAPLVKAQSTAIARAIASICNAEQGCFGVTSGHGRKTLRLPAAGGPAAVPHAAAVPHRG